MQQTTPSTWQQSSLEVQRPAVRHRFRDLPLVTATIAAAALVASVFPTLSMLLEYDRAAILSGQAHRLLTGHLVHWSFDHLLWDVVMFAALGAFLERHSRRLLTAVLAASVAGISASLWFLAPEVLIYRGLSGLDSALFAAVLVVLLADALASRHRTITVIVGLLAAAFVAKLGYETTTGLTLFVDSAKAGFTPLPFVHAAGAGVGAAVAVVYGATRGLAR